MRIVAISDIHARRNGLDRNLVHAIRDQAEQLSPDVFVIAGDLSENITDLRENLNLLSLPDTDNLYVSGNHDIWFEEDLELGSLEKYSKVIGNICDECGFIHLPDSPFVKGDIAFVGSMGWYDYSFRRQDLDISETQYSQKQWRGHVWRDYYAVDWPYTDAEFTELLNDKLKYDLETLPKNVKKIVYVSHHLPFQELTLYKDSLPWDFFSAFMGSVKTGAILEKDPRIVLTISGHSHIRHKAMIGTITAITVPLGYGRQVNNDYTQLAHDALAVIELDDSGLSLSRFVEGDICEGLPYLF